jgi:hypothetical protein
VWDVLIKYPKWDREDPVEGLISILGFYKVLVIVMNIDE